MVERHQHTENRGRGSGGPGSGGPALAVEKGPLTDLLSSVGMEHTEEADGSGERVNNSTGWTVHGFLQGLRLLAWQVRGRGWAVCCHRASGHIQGSVCSYMIPAPFPPSHSWHVEPWLGASQTSRRLDCSPTHSEYWYAAVGRFFCLANQPIVPICSGVLCCEAMRICRKLMGHKAPLAS